MKLWKRTPLLLAATVAVGAAFTSAVFAQGYDTAYVPFLVNVNAAVSATDGVTTPRISVTANNAATLRIPLQKTDGVRFFGTQRQPNAPTIARNRNGNVVLNLPAQSYKNAEILLYTVNGKRILRSNAYTASAANSITLQNLAMGVYMLSVRGTASNAVTSRLTHNGGGLNISVVFGGGDLSAGKRLAKEAAVGDWTITVEAAGYVDTVYTLRPTAGPNSQQNITLHALTSEIGVPTDVTATTMSSISISINWLTVSGATGYFIYRSTNSSDGYDIAGSAQSPPYTNAWLTPGTTYYYKVSAYNSDGDESPFSSEVSATTKTITKIMGKFTDSRNNKEYKTATIGGKTWMAENLNYDPQKGNCWCYDNTPDSCVKYGMLYDWATAMNINTNFNNALLGGSDVNRQGVCPTGWHLSSHQEWNDLEKAVGSSAATKLKSKSDWNGTDDYGFSALPGGLCFQYDDSDVEFFYVGEFGGWWTDTNAYFKFMASDGFVREDDFSDKDYRSGASVRCVKN